MNDKMVNLFPIRHRPALSWLCILGVLYSILGCARLDINDGVFPLPVRYTVGVPAKGWEPMRVDKEDLALWHKQCRAMIAIISSGAEGKGLSVRAGKQPSFYRDEGQAHYNKGTRDGMQSGCITPRWSV